VRPQTHDAFVSFQVQDNGKGFDMTKVARDAGDGGLALMAMDERVRMLGGSLEISSQEGQGTKVSFVVPTRIGKVNG
jgi:signal transduction histidine kinase